MLHILLLQALSAGITCVVVFCNYLRSDVVNFPKIMTCSHYFFTEIFLYHLKYLFLLLKVNCAPLKKFLGVELFTFFHNFITIKINKIRKIGEYTL